MMGARVWVGFQVHLVDAGETDTAVAGIMGGRVGGEGTRRIRHEGRNYNIRICDLDATGLPAFWVEVTDIDSREKTSVLVNNPEMVRIVSPDGKVVIAGIYVTDFATK